MFVQDLVEISAASFLSILIDGSSDSSTIENDIVYMRVVGPDGRAENIFLGLEAVPESKATGILEAVNRGKQPMNIFIR